jgi:thiol:disulfide interchange protein
MLHMKKIIPVIVLMVIFGVSSFLRAEVKFKDISLSEAQKEAKSEKKLIMIDFFTDWCKWCKVLDQKTYSDEEVGKFADGHFVSIKINADDKGGPGTQIANKYQIQGYPTVIFLNEKGVEVHRVVGYQEAKTFLSSMKTATDKKAVK